MDPRLMDKEVLCGYDIRQIQSYIFAGDNEATIAGASILVKNIIHEALRYGVEKFQPPLQPEQYQLNDWDSTGDIPYFHDPRILIQLIYVGGGNAFVLYRKGSICQQINRRISRYFLDHSYSLTLAAGVVEKTDDIVADTSRLYDELDKIKFSMKPREPLCSLPIVETEQDTGYPVIGRDRETGELISEESMLKSMRYRASGRKESLMRVLSGSGMIAMVHADGNNMGNALKTVMQTATDYESGIKIRRYVNKNINDSIVESISQTEAWFLQKLRNRGIGEEEIKRSYYRFEIGGDDVNFIILPQYALSFVEYFIKECAKRVMWYDEKIGEIKFSFCAGVAFVGRNVSYSNGIKIAEEACQSAKFRGKKPENLINGQVGNWIDFHMSENATMENLDYVRSRVYKDTQNNSLLLRPYCLDPESRKFPFSFERFKEYAAFFRAQKKMRTQIQKLQNAHSFGKPEVRDLLEELKLQGLEMPRKFGSPYVKVQDEQNQTCAKWFDAIEMYEVFEDLMEEIGNGDHQN